jgi:hypothetical protein
MALTKKGSFAYGIAETVAGITSLTSWEAGHENTTNQTAKDKDGAIVAHVFGNPKNTFRAEGYAAAATVPALDSALTLGGVSGYVMRTGITASNEDFVKCSIEGEGYPGL